MNSLRPYQTDVVADFVLLPDGVRVLIIAPTGSGKTVIAVAITRRQVERYRRVLFLAHRREIITQTSRKLFEHGVSHGIILAGIDPRPMEQVQVASVQTLWSRALRSEAMQLPPADLVIVDECHHARAETYEKIIYSYKNATLIGLTATPCRGDGRGLGNIFTRIIECQQVADLIEKGFLVKSKVYAPVNQNLSCVKTQSGDYVISQLSDRVNTDKLVGDIVTHWHKYGERRKTICFAVDVKHSAHITEEFCKAGVRAEHLDGGTPTKEREAILSRLASGETELVSNCMVLTEGFDCPDIGTLILARPTKQMGLFRQMIGRALRPAHSKVDAVILDHSGAVFRHGLSEDPIEWTLDTDKRAKNPTHEGRGKGEHGGGLIECTQCGTLRLGGQPCPSCGFMPKHPAQYVPFQDGELGRVIAGQARGPVYDAAARHDFRRQLAHIATERGYARGWISHKYREKFGMWPPYGDATPLAPTPEVLSWVRSRAIAFAKTRGRVA